MADKMLMTIVTICLAVKAAIPGMFLVMEAMKSFQDWSDHLEKSTVSLAAIILGRDAILGLVAIYIRYISLPAPKTFIRYWDFSLPSAEVRPTGISKVNTALQLALVGWTMTGMAIGGDLGVWGEDGALLAMWLVRPILLSFDCGWITPVKKVVFYTAFFFGLLLVTAQVLLDLSVRTQLLPLRTNDGNHRYLVGATTVWSGVSYIYTKDAVKILNTGIRKQRSGKF